MTLTGPNSQVITLSSRNGSSEEDVFTPGTVFDVDADPGNPAPYDAAFGGLADSKMVTDAEYESFTPETPVTPEQGFEKFFGSNPNGNWTLKVTDPGSGDDGTLVSWSISVKALPNSVCELAAANDITLSTDLGEATATYTADAPDFVEPVDGICEDAVVTVEVDGGAAQPEGTEFELGIGEHDVVFTVTSDCGPYTESLQVVVEDNEDPVVTNCPASNLVFTLGPGQCDYQFDLVLNATDNAGFPGGGLTATSEIHQLLNADDSPYTFEVTFEDAAGNEATCEFDVIINPFPNPITSLICNDLVTVSLDESCTLELNADDILEGGPYRCYDKYLVQLDRSLPLGNGPWMPGELSASDVHKTWAVRVVDDVNGNGVADPGENTCWGNIAIEDKLPPVFVDCGCGLVDQGVAVSSFAGEIDADDPTFVRPNSAGTTCSTSFDNVTPYETYTFEVTEAGEYTFAQSETPPDGFAALYAGSFDPANSCSNFIVADDDSTKCC